MKYIAPEMEMRALDVEDIMASGEQGGTSGPTKPGGFVEEEF